MAKIEELKGFCYPLSPEGKCSLLGNPPWHYGTEYLNIAYRVDPDAVAKWLPEPVELGDHPDVAYVASGGPYGTATRTWPGRTPSVPSTRKLPSGWAAPTRASRLRCACPSG